MYCAKPRSCRNSSIEAFLVAKDFKGRDQLGLHSAELNSQDLLTTLNHLKNYSSIYFEEEELDDEEDMVQFVPCGKDDPFDPDMNYSLTTSTQVPLQAQEESKEAPDQHLAVKELKE